MTRTRQEPVFGRIYEAATGQGSWDGVLADVSAQVDAGSAFFFSAHSKSERTMVANVHNLSPQMVSDFFSHWYTEDLWEHGARRVGVRPGQVVLGTELVPQEEVMRSGYFADFLRPNGISSMVGSMLFGPDDPDGMPLTHICWYRPQGRECFGERERRRLHSVLPHVQLALRLRRRLSWCSDGPQGSALTAMYVAALELNAQGAILRHNDAATALLERLPRACVRFGVLRGLGERSAPSLPDALAACTAANPVRIAAYLAGDVPQVVMATLVCMPDEDGGRFLLLVELPRARGREVALSVAPLFGLSPAEERVLAELLEGRSPAAIADACGTSLPTVRTQVSSILAKTGTKGQVELLLLLRSLRF